MQTEQSVNKSAAQADNSPDQTRELFNAIPTVRIFTLSCIATRLAETNFAKLAGLRLTQARLLLVLGVLGPSKLERVTREMSLESALASRSVTSLVEGRLVSREPHRTDGRASELVLTEDGQQQFQKIYSNVRAWNDEWLSVLSKSERKTFLSCVDKLIGAAREKARQQNGDQKASRQS